MSATVKRVEEPQAYVVFPYKGEYAVCHMGQAKVCGEDLFQTVWVADGICPTLEQAAQLQDELCRKAKARVAQVLADLKVLERRR